MNTRLGKSLIGALLIVVFLLLGNIVWAKSESERIVASIKPIQLLVEEIRGFPGDTVLLLQSNQSLHKQSIKPSQKGYIETAHRIFYISDGFESYLAKAKRADAGPGAEFKYVELGKADGIRLLSVRASGALPHVYMGDDYGEGAVANQASNGHSHGAGAIDWHLWLNPDNAIIMLDSIRSTLTEIHPEKRDFYQRNFDNASLKIIQQSKRIADKMMRVMKMPFITLHDGYQYFEEQYGLRSKGTILQSGHQLSVQRVKEMREMIQEYGIECLFAEVEMYSAMAMPVVDGLNVDVVLLDSLGQTSQGIDSYTKLIDNFASKFYRGMMVE